jgi:ABC-type Na+ efflux pump permease subunit
VTFAADSGSSLGCTGGDVDDSETLTGDNLAAFETLQGDLAATSDQVDDLQDALDTKDTELADLEAQVAALAAANQSSTVVSSDSSVTSEDGSSQLPSWGVAVFIILAFMACFVGATLCLVVKREKEGRPIFRTLDLPPAAKKSADVVMSSTTKDASPV